MSVWTNVKFLRSIDDKVTTSVETSLDGVRSVQDDHNIEDTTNGKEGLLSLRVLD